MITARIDRMMASCRSRDFRPTSITLGLAEAALLAAWIDDQRGITPDSLERTPAERLQGARYRDTPIDVCGLATFLRVEAIWVDRICEAEDLEEPPQ